MSELSSRRPEVERLRGFALLLGIPLHAAMPFFSLGQMVTPISSQENELWAALVYTSIHIFRMPLFFFIAGYAVEASLSRRKVGEFIRSRIWKLGLPLLFGLMMMPYIDEIILNWATMYQLESLSYIRAKQSGWFQPGNYLWHLWFLYYLLIYSLIAVVWKTLRVRFCGFHKNDFIRELLSMPSGWGILALGSSLILFWDSSIYSGGWKIKPGYFLFQGCFFMVGMSFRAHVSFEIFHHLRRKGFFTFVFLQLLFVWICLTEEGFLWINYPESLLACICRSCLSWFLVFALFCVFMSYSKPLSRLEAIIARSSYWIYYIHVPLLFALQVFLMPYSMGLGGFGLALLLTLVLGLLTYFLLVEKTFLSRIFLPQSFKKPSSQKLEDVPA